MRFIFINLIVIAALCLPVHAQATTQPMLNPTVMVFPFRQLGQPSAHAWVPEALQEDLKYQIAGTNFMQPIPADPAAGVPDDQAAIAVAKAAHVGFAVYGSYQVVGDQLRLLGNVYDCGADRNVTTLQATGNLIDFFKMEDTLGDQLRQALPQTPPANYGVNVTPAAGSYYAPQVQPSEVYPDDTGSYDQGNANAYPGDAYGYYNPYAFYGSAYPWYSFIVINGHRFRVAHHGGGFNHSPAFHAGVSSGAVENRWFSFRPATPFSSSAARPSFGISHGSFGGGFHGSVSHSFRSAVGHGGGGGHGGGHR